MPTLTEASSLGIGGIDLGLERNRPDMKNTEATRNIEAQATSTFGKYNPVAKVTCPHCGGIMQAIDAKKHVA